MSREREYNPLSYTQAGALLLSLAFPGTGVESIAATVRFKETVDYLLLEQAINTALYRNDGLRLRLAKAGGQVKQYVSEYHEIKLDSFRFGEEEEYGQWTGRQMKKRVRLLESDLFYFAFIGFEGGGCGLFLKVSHIIADGSSVSLLVDQITGYYRDLEKGSPLSEEKMPSYIEHLLAEEEYKNSPKAPGSQKFWEERLRSVPAAASLKPGAFKLPGTQSRRRTFHIPDKLTEDIYKACTELHTSVFMLFISVLSIYISTVNSKEDAGIGIMLHNRLSPRQQKTFGLFAAVVPLRILLGDGMDFKALLGRSAEQVKHWVRERVCPFEPSVKNLLGNVIRVSSLFNIVLSYENYTHENELEWHSGGREVVDAILCVVGDREKGLKMEFYCRTGLFADKDVEELYWDLLNILAAAIKSPGKRIAEIREAVWLEKRLPLFKEVLIPLKNFARRVAKGEAGMIIKILPEGFIRWILGALLR